MAWVTQCHLQEQTRPSARASRPWRTTVSPIPWWRLKSLNFSAEFHQIKAQLKVRVLSVKSGCIMNLTLFGAAFPTNEYCTVYRLGVGEAVVVGNRWPWVFYYCFCITSVSLELYSTDTCFVIPVLTHSCFSMCSNGGRMSKNCFAISQSVNSVCYML
jgi:hypothetical protein